MLKMDDINQKENQVKLSMQAMEMRISNLEDLGLYSHLRWPSLWLTHKVLVIRLETVVRTLFSTHLFDGLCI